MNKLRLHLFLFDLRRPLTNDGLYEEKTSTTLRDSVIVTDNLSESVIDNILKFEGLVHEVMILSAISIAVTCHNINT